MPIIDPDRDPALNQDEPLTPYQRAQSWLYMMWMDVYHKCMVMIEEKLLEAAGTLSGGGHGGVIAAEGPIAESTAPYGPTNLSGDAWTVSRAFLQADAGVTCEAYAGATLIDTLVVADGAAGEDDNTGLSVTWADGDSLSWALTGIEEGLSRVTLTVWAA